MLNVGDKVMMMDEKFRLENPRNYPPKGAMGVVVEYSSREDIALVNWGKDSGVEPNVKDEYTWWCSASILGKISANAANA